MLVEMQLLGVILGSEGEVACYAAVPAVTCCWESQVCVSVGGMSSSSSSLRFLLLRDTPLAFRALVFSKHGHEVDICKDCGYHTVAGRLEKHVCVETLRALSRCYPTRNTRNYALARTATSGARVA